MYVVLCIPFYLPTCIIIIDPTDEGIDSASSNPDEADAASPAEEAAEDEITPGSLQLACPHLSPCLTACYHSGRKFYVGKMVTLGYGGTFLYPQICSYTYMCCEYHGLDCCC